ALLRRDTIRWIPHAIRRQRTSVGWREARSSRPAAGTGEPAILPPRYVLLPARSGRGALLSGRIRYLRQARAAYARAETDCRERRRSVPLRLQRSGGGQDSGAQQPLPANERGPCALRISRNRSGVRRVPEG